MRYLKLFKLDLWILLSLIGIVVWFVSDWMTDRILKQSYNPSIKLNADAHPKIRLALTPTVSSIVARADQDNEITEVTFNVTNSSLKELEFEFSIEDFQHIETVLVQEFGLHPKTVKRLIQYPDEQDGLTPK